VEDSVSQIMSRKGPNQHGASSGIRRIIKFQTPSLKAGRVVKRLDPKINPPGLQRLFGDSAIARILDFLTLYKDWDYSMTDIAKNSGVGWRTLLRLWPALEHYQVVELTRQVGKAKMYRLNERSKVARTLEKLAFQIPIVDAKLVAKQELAKQEQLQREEPITVPP
jgi:hypothetical protein